MTFKAEVSLYSVDGEEWTVDMAHYVVSNTRTESKGRLKLENLDIVEGLLKEGDVLIKRPGKPRRFPPKSYKPVRKPKKSF